jgi:hypothetical protein
MLQCSIRRDLHFRASPQRERDFGSATISDRLSL